MLLVKESVLRLKEKTTKHGLSYFKIAHKYYTIFYDWPVKYYVWVFGYMIARLYDRVQLSIYSTRAVVHKYFVAMRYRWIWLFLIFERKSIFNKIYYTNKLHESSLKSIISDQLVQPSTYNLTANKQPYVSWLKVYINIHVCYMC